MEPRAGGGRYLFRAARGRKGRRARVYPGRISRNAHPRSPILVGRRKPGRAGGDEQRAQEIPAGHGIQASADRYAGLRRFLGPG
ncbi:hypothetical protein D3C76_750800 [compost metagenome]